MLTKFGVYDTRQNRHTAHPLVAADPAWLNHRSRHTIESNSKNAYRLNQAYDVEAISNKSLNHFY